MRPTAAVPAPARFVSLAVLALAGVGCGSNYKPMTLETDPQGAKVLVDGADKGASPTSYTFDFTDGSKAYNVTASQPGYLDTKVKVTADTPELKTGTLRVTLAPDQAFVATVPSDATNQWVLVQTDPKLTKEAVWQKLVSAATDRYGRVASLDYAAGYLQSAPYSQQFPHPTARTMTVRTELIATIASEQPLVYKLKLVSQVAYGNNPDQWSDYGRVFPDDAKLIGQIKAAIGVQ